MKRLTFALFVISALAVGAFMALGRDGAHANPDPVITVNGYDDSYSRDGQMTLREAVLLATGAISVTALSQAECIRVSPASWDATLGCSSSEPPGASSADTIVFDAAIFPPGSPGTITLNSQQLQLHTGGDSVDGSGAGVIVDGGNLTFTCFLIGSGNNSIKGLEIHHCSYGIGIYSGSGNTIGGSTAAERNVISGNTYGVGIQSATLNSVKGNYIGTDAGGTSAIPNTIAGVFINSGAQNNTIGGGSAAERNVISGNDSGVLISDAGTTNNRVIGNYIGANAAGTAALPNGTGVLIKQAGQNNTIGGGSAAERNVISGNDFGVVISDAGTINNRVIGNYIGINAAGTAIIPDTVQGVVIAAGAQNNTIGGSSTSERNVISGNGIGVVISVADANTVKGNYIGTNAAGTAAVANGRGVIIAGGAKNNTVGGNSAGERNVISGNNDIGVVITDVGTNGNSVQGNYVGTNATGTAAMPNNTAGVLVAGAAQNNAIGGTAAGEGNLIAFNTGDGVRVSDTGTTGNTVRGNSIHSNGAKGIENVFGGNNEKAPPVITGFGSVMGTACANCTIDVYSDDEDEGKVYEGSTTADNAGDWTFDGSPEGPNVTATATDAAGNTSEFSAPVEAPEATPTPTPTPTATPSATATPAGPTRTLQWGVGWNNATWSGASTPEEVFACAAGKYAAAYRYVDGGLERYFPDRPDISNMTPLSKYDAFLILITEPVTCVMPVTADSGTSRTLEWGMGWNNAGWSGADGTLPEQAFVCADGSYAAAYRFTEVGLERYFPGRPDISNMVPLNKYDAFLILLTAPVNCTMPVGS